MIVLPHLRRFYIPPNFTFQIYRQFSKKMVIFLNMLISFTHSQFFHSMFLFCQAAKLTPDERGTKLSPLLANRWSLVDDRDAIKKEFIFKNFNEVSLELNHFNVRTAVLKIFHYFSRHLDS